MQRKKFLLSTAAAIPALLIGKQLPAQTPKRPNKAFVVKAGESRFGEKTSLGGKSPNDIKVSQKDTNSDLTVFEYTGNEKAGRHCMYIPSRMRSSSLLRANIFSRWVPISIP